MTAPISATPWDLAAGNRWFISGDNDVHGDSGNETVVDAQGTVIAYVAGGMEAGNGALLAAAPALRTALDEAVRVLDKIAGAEMPRGRMWEIVGEVMKVSRAALKQAGAL